jgi:surfactin synthase thioesterase subunit
MSEPDNQISAFENDLTCLINKHSRENDSNTPDYILAGYIQGCLLAFNTAVQQREQWYGRDPRPSLVKGGDNV